MKKITLIYLLSLISLFSNGQYSMTTTTTSYQPLSSPISLNVGTVWNSNSSYHLSLGFNFMLSGYAYTTIDIDAGGEIGFTGTSANNQLMVYYSPFAGSLLIDRGILTSLSPLSYEITGTTGQHIFKAEWQNAGFRNYYPVSDSTDYVDFQIWLFELDSHIEIHFGNNDTDPLTYGYPDGTSDPDPGPSVQFFYGDCSGLGILCLTGTANLPSYGFYAACSPAYTSIDGTPSIGITYNFYPTLTTSISEISAEQISVFPNPFSEQTTINFPEEQINVIVKITDVTGREVKTIVYSGKQLIIEKGEMAKGVYNLQIIDSNHNVINKKMIVQ
ncbi:MAG: hypothetical protein JWP12_1114 [Bacteroidetes bacterium]|nr:hypothetical protein [Bacteroidota bacterium]